MTPSIAEIRFGYFLAEVYDSVGEFGGAIADVACAAGEVVAVPKVS